MQLAAGSLDDALKKLSVMSGRQAISGSGMRVRGAGNKMEWRLRVCGKGRDELCVHLPAYGVLLERRYSAGLYPVFCRRHAHAVRAFSVQNNVIRNGLARVEFDD